MSREHFYFASVLAVSVFSNVVDQCFLSLPIVCFLYNSFSQGSQLVFALEQWLFEFPTFCAHHFSSSVCAILWLRSNIFPDSFCFAPTRPFVWHLQFIFSIWASAYLVRLTCMPFANHWHCRVPACCVCISATYFFCVQQLRIFQKLRLVIGKLILVHIV